MLLRRLAVLLAASAALVSIARAADSSNSDPADQPRLAISRTATSDLVLKPQLSQNIYRQEQHSVTEPVQVPYTVSVPYDAQVAYTVSVPYQDTETYYTQENRCTNQSYNSCDNVQHCHTENEPSQICNTTPNGQRNCTTVNRPRNVCSTERVCHPESREVCSTVNVPHTRYVTNYRNETRYRTETRYRDETRYRTEMRTRIVTEQIYVRQLVVPVEVQFPQASALQGTEQETIALELSGTETQPVVAVTVTSPVFTYRIVSNQIMTDKVVIVLAAGPKYQGADVADRTVKNLILAKSATDAYQIQFDDLGTVARSSTQYDVELIDVDTGESRLHTQLLGAVGASKVVVPVTTAVQKDHDHLVRLRVSRSGASIASPVVFQVETRQMGTLDPTEYAREENVRDFAITGENDSAELNFTDATLLSGKVETKYTITLLRKPLIGSRKTLGSAVFARTALKNDADGKVHVAVKAVDGIDAKELKRFFDKGDQVIVQVHVNRTSSRLPGTKIDFDRESKVKL